MVRGVGAAVRPRAATGDGRRVPRGTGGGRGRRSRPPSEAGPGDRRAGAGPGPRYDRGSAGRAGRGAAARGGRRDRGGPGPVDGRPRADRGGPGRRPGSRGPRRGDCASGRACGPAPARDGPGGAARGAGPARGPSHRPGPGRQPRAADRGRAARRGRAVPVTPGETHRESAQASVTSGDDTPWYPENEGPRGRAPSSRLRTSDPARTAGSCAVRDGGPRTRDCPRPWRGRGRSGWRVRPRGCPRSWCRGRRGWG